MTARFNINDRVVVDLPDGPEAGAVVEVAGDVCEVRLDSGGHVFLNGDRPPAKLETEADR